MTMIQTVIKIVGISLFATGVGPGSPRGMVAEGPPRPVDVLREAVETAQTVNDPGHRDALLGDLADGLSILGAIPDAIAVKDAIGDQSIREGVIRSIVTAQAEAGDVAGAKHSAEALDTALARQNGYRSSALSEIAGAQAKAGDWDGAIRTARRLESWDRSFAMARAIRTRAEAGDLDGAINQARTRLEGAREPSAQGGFAGPSPRALAILEIVRVLADRNELDRAVRLLDAHPEVKVQGLAAIVRARFKAKDLDAAATAARRLLDQGGDWQSEASARVVLVRSLIAQDKLDAAIEAARGPWKQPDPPRSHSQPMQPSVEPLRNRALVAVGRAQIEQGHLDAALTTLSKVPGGLARAFDLIELARERLERDDRSSAAKLVSAAHAAMDESTGSEFYLQDVAAVMFRCGQVEPARRLFARALFARDIGSAINRPIVARTQAQAGDMEGGLRTIASIPEAEGRDYARLWLAVQHARDGKADAALDFASAIADPSYRAAATAQVGMILAQRGDRERGAATCPRAAEIVETPTPEVARVPRARLGRDPGRGRRVAGLGPPAADTRIARRVPAGRVLGNGRAPLLGRRPLPPGDPGNHGCPAAATLHEWRPG